MPLARFDCPCSDFTARLFVIVRNVLSLPFLNRHIYLDILTSVGSREHPRHGPLNNPCGPEILSRRHGKPAVKRAGMTKRMGFHTFRHTYATLLTQNNEDVKVVQELLRHANRRITLDLYALVGMPEKRQAQRKVVQLFLRKGKALA